MSTTMEILIFAILAGYLFFRLWSVLGQRTGHDQNPKSSDDDLFGWDGNTDLEKSGTQDNVVSLHGISDTAPQGKNGTAANIGRELTELHRQKLAMIEKEDKSFDLEAFLKGAERAYSAILKSFSEGDEKILKKLLNSKVYKEFSSVIRQRVKNKQTLESDLQDIKDQDVLAVDVKRGVAAITVRFVSQQMNATKNAEGQILDNPARLSISLTDIWTFSRSLKSKEPNWVLSATRSEEN